MYEKLKGQYSRRNAVGILMAASLFAGTGIVLDTRQARTPAQRAVFVDVAATRTAKEHEELVGATVEASKGKAATAEKIGKFSAEDVQTVLAATGRLYVRFGTPKDPIGDAEGTGWYIQPPDAKHTPYAYIATAAHVLRYDNESDPDHIYQAWFQQGHIPGPQENAILQKWDIAVRVPAAYPGSPTNDEGLIRIPLPDGAPRPKGLRYNPTFTFEDDEELLVAGFPQEVPVTGTPVYVTTIRANSLTFDNGAINTGLSDLGLSGAAVVAERHGELQAVALVSAQGKYHTHLIYTAGLQDMDAMFASFGHKRAE